MKNKKIPFPRNSTENKWDYLQKKGEADIFSSF